MNDDQSRRDFLARQSTDPEFAEAIASARSMADAIDIAAQHGIHVSAATIRSLPLPLPPQADSGGDDPRAGRQERGPTY